MDRSDWKGSIWFCRLLRGRSQGTSQWLVRCALVRPVSPSRQVFSRGFWEVKCWMALGGSGLVSARVGRW
jgi:hypothetical protein